MRKSQEEGGQKQGRREPGENVLPTRRVVATSTEEKGKKAAEPGEIGRPPSLS